MGVFFRAIVYGFGFSLGSALFKRVSNQLGFEDENSTDKDAKTKPPPDDDGDGDGDGDTATSRG